MKETTMKSRRLMLMAVTSACLLATTGVFGQNRAAGPFDGKWVGESARCSPASNSYRFNNLTITNSSFNWTATDRGRQAQCKVAVKREGSFESDKDCPFQLTGRFEGPKLMISIKTSERNCDIVAKRE
jgi:hypothetical protein